jgi:hypothetical protein
MGDVYISKAELRSDPYGISLDMADDIHLGILQDITKDMIDNACNQDFLLTGTHDNPVEYKYDGKGKNTIFPTKRIVELVKVRAYISTDNWVDYDATNFIVKPKFISWNAYSSTYINLRVAFRQWIFEKGTANVGIWGTWGYASIPNPIKYLQGKLILKYLEDNTLIEKYQETKIGDFWGTLIQEDGDNPFGDFELNSIVKQYRDAVQYGVV